MDRPEPGTILADFTFAVLAFTWGARRRAFKPSPGWLPVWEEAKKAFLP